MMLTVKVLVLFLFCFHSTWAFVPTRSTVDIAMWKTTSPRPAATWLRMVSNAARPRDTKHKNTNNKVSSGQGISNEQQRFLHSVHMAAQELDVEQFHTKLKSFAYHNTGVDFSADLFPIMIRLKDEYGLENIGATAISDWLWALPRVGLKIGNPQHRALTMELVHRFVGINGLTPRQVTTSLGGLARMRFKWSQLPEQMRTDIVTALDLVAINFNDREIGNCLHSLSKLQIPWTSLPPSVRSALLEVFVRESAALISQQGSMAIYSLGMMGLDITSTPQAIQDHIYLVGSTVVQEASHNRRRTVAQQVTNVVYGFAKMACKWPTIPPHVQRGITDAILSLHQSLNEQEVANLLYSLGLVECKWENLDPEVQHVLLDTTAERFPRMIAQGLSCSIYGLALMGAKWCDFPPSLCSAAAEGIHHMFEDNFGASKGALNHARAAETSQGVANIVYSLGLLGASWSELPPAISGGLTQGLIRWAPELTSQELSNAIYGLGMLKAQYEDLSFEMRDALVSCLSRIMTSMNDQEVCSTLHGYAKMGATWETLPHAQQKAIYVAIASLARVGELCLACSLYSLGMMGAQWDKIPHRIQHIFMRTAAREELRDQTISNVVYGLSLLKTSWASLDDSFRSVITDSLGRERAFGSDVPQHISNSIWGLAKMDAAWSEVPGEAIMRAFVRCHDRFAPQEVSNSLYGLAVMDTAWSDLQVTSQVALASALKHTAPDMTPQEVANVMYSLAIMTFDAAYKPLEDTSPAAQALWGIHRTAVGAFTRIPASTYEKENFDQFAMYFELLGVIPGGRALLKSVTGADQVITLTCTLTLTLFDPSQR